MRYLPGTWKMQVDLTPNLLDAPNDALGLICRWMIPR